MNQEELLLRHQALGYGRSAQELLETCRIFAEVEEEWTSRDLYAFKGRAGINDQVWKKLLAIHKDERLPKHVEILPTNYNALFSLTRYSNEELERALQQGLIAPKTSYRAINNWRKQYSGDVDAERRGLFVALPDVEIKAFYHQENDVTETIRAAIVDLAERYPTLKVIHTLPTRSSSRPLLQGSKTPARIADLLKAAIDERASEFLEEAAMLDLQLHNLRRDKPEGLKNLSLKSFKELLVKIVGSTEAFWQRCGTIYQFRIGLEVAKSDTYAVRDKHVSHLVSNAGSHDLQEVTDEILSMLHEEE